MVARDTNEFFGKAIRNAIVGIGGSIIEVCDGDSCWFHIDSEETEA
jgi:hypothetical protein